MSLELPDSTDDLFAKSITPTPGPRVEALAGPSAQTQGRMTLPPKESIGGVISAVLRDDPALKKQMTAAEQAAVEAVVKDVGTPDEYPSAMEYVLRALPYVRSVYSSMDVIQPIMPTNEELSILMKTRFLSL